MLSIREATVQDFQAICELMKNELGYHDLDETETLNRLEYFRHSNDWATFVASADDEIVGFIGVMKGITFNIDGHYAQIMAIAVSERTRRSGIGAALIRKAETWSLSNGIKYVTVNCNMKRHSSHIFYEKLGYIKTSFSFKKSL